jgi:hypothetical protein
LSTYVSPAHTRYAQPVFLSLLGVAKNYGTARMTAQHSLHGRNAKQEATKVENIKQQQHVFMQGLDSKDKIAMRLQPIRGKYLRRRLAALCRLPRPTLALTRATFDLGI